MKPWIGTENFAIQNELNIKENGAQVKGWVSLKTYCG